MHGSIIMAERQIANIIVTVERIDTQAGFTYSRAEVAPGYWLWLIEYGPASLVLKRDCTTTEWLRAHAYLRFLVMYGV